MTKPTALLNWSGGKDSSICLYKTLQSETYHISCLFTTLNAKYDRVSQHGVMAELLEKQAEYIGIPLKKLYLPDIPTMENYNRAMADELIKLKKEGIRISIFGDIFLEDLRRYRQERLSEIGCTGVFPLWKQSTEVLAKEFIEEGFKAVVVCIDEKHLARSFIGREYDESFLNDLPREVDPCGENGEFHTFVYDGPIFKKPVFFTRGEVVYRRYELPEQQADESEYICGTDRSPHPATGFWYCDLLPDLRTSAGSARNKAGRFR